MRCALASKGFINDNCFHNKNVIIDTMKEYAGEADIIIFGEAFLQGFYGANFDVEHDEKIALAMAVSFGFIEKSGEKFYSSQITIDATGQVIDLYRRVSPGWKEEFASERYCEGKGFHTFMFRNRKVVVGLCGDLWFDENIDEINRLTPDVVFWPVYTDYNQEEWNSSVKHEYAEQAGRLRCKVLYVNSVCLDKEGDEIAKGGSALFSGGHIETEVPSGKEDVLIVEV